MKEYKKILLALDLKDDKKVQEHCKAFAECTNAEISIVHAVDPIDCYGGTSFNTFNVEQIQESLELAAKKQVADIAKDLSVPAERQHVEIGLVKDVILNVSNKINADVTMLGSHGRHGLSAFLFGDTAGDVTHNAKVDVLTVPVTA